MTTPAEKKARGTQAENLLNDPMLQEALREVRYAAHRAFEKAGSDPVKLRRASEQWEAAGAFQRFLTVAMKAGQAASKEMDRELQASRVMRGVGRFTRNREAEAEDMPWHAQR